MAYAASVHNNLDSLLLKCLAGRLLVKLNVQEPSEGLEVNMAWKICVQSCQVPFLFWLVHL
jgi:hypothetical protein